MFPVPAKETADFCLNNPAFDNFSSALGSTLNQTLKICLILLLLLAALSIIPFALVELWKWNRLKAHASRLIRSLTLIRPEDSLELLHTVQDPLSSTLIHRFCAHRSNTARALIKWFLAYITSPRALFILLLAVIGFLSCLLQYIMVRSLIDIKTAVASDIANATVAVTQNISTMSAEWANGVNAQISHVGNGINQNMLDWVGSAAQSLNATLNLFVNDTVSLLNATFGGTILYEPVLDVVNCLFLLKIEKLEQGLTFINDHSQISLPLIDTDILSQIALNASTNSSSSSSQTLASSTSIQAEIESSLDVIINKWLTCIKSTACWSSGFLLVYLLLLLGGTARVWIAASRNKRMTQRYAPGPLSQHPAALGAFTFEFNSRDSNYGEKHYPPTYGDVIQT